MRLVESQKIGIVATSQAGWRNFLQCADEKKFDVDFNDASIVVEFQGKGDRNSHGHIQPICLEKVEVNEDTMAGLRSLIED